MTTELTAETWLSDPLNRDSLASKAIIRRLMKDRNVYRQQRDEARDENMRLQRIINRIELEQVA